MYLNIAKRYKMKPFLTTTILTLFFFSPSAIAADKVSSNSFAKVVLNTYGKDYIPTYTDRELRERLQKIHSAISKPRLTPAVKSYIKTYTVKKREHTEAMLGRMSIYFPIFEQYLKETNMPDDLKYLSVVESALNPMARSRSGAVGLWQFMPPTGRESGLKINSTVDERRDPHKATKAALKYLLKQYRRYGNWELALAAYNGGPGRVNRAIKRGRSKNFWHIQRYLPRETQNYVPAFIAATYIAHYYHLHNLSPIYPSQDLQVTQKIKIYKRLSFREISNATGTPMELIQTLNPSYKRNYIPTNRRGSNLVLPQNYMYSMLDHLGRPDTEIKHITSAPIPAPIDKEWESRHIRVNYTIGSQDDLESIANNYGCTSQNLKNWNQLRNNYLRSGQQLVIYVPKPKNFHFYQPIQNVPTINMESIGYQYSWQTQLKKGKRKKKIKAKRQFIPKFNSDKAFKKEAYRYHHLKKNETLIDVAEKYSGVNVKQLIELNEIRNIHLLKPGTVLRVKKK